MAAGKIRGRARKEGRAGDGRRAGKGRAPLSRERVFAEAVGLADEGGLEAVTMRGLADRLGVEAMSLYHYVPNKDAILDGMVDLVFAEIELPRADLGWKRALRRRTESVREALVRHAWALSVIETRASPGAMTLTHHDAVLGCLRGAGFSLSLAAHAYALLDAFVFGFVHTELSLPFSTPEEAHEVASAIIERIPPGAFPHLVELAKERVLMPGYAYGGEFDFGLDLILDGLERALDQARDSKRAPTIR